MSFGCHEFRSLNRRQMLRIGGGGLFGLTLSGILRSQAQAEALGVTPKAKQMIVIWLEGGPPHQDMVDMKPEAPEELRGPWRPMKTNVPGMEVSELMPSLARVCDKLTFLRSCNAKGYPLENQHGIQAAWAFLSGSRRNNRGTPKYPMFGSAMAKVRPGPADLPQNVILGNPAKHDSYLGAAFDPLELKLDDDDDKMTKMLAPPAERLDLDSLTRRTHLLAQMDRQIRTLDSAEELISGLDHFKQRAFDLLRSPKIRNALDLTREDPRTLERYGKERDCRKVLAARRLIEAGVPYVHVDFRTWDFHGGGGTYRKAEQNITDLGRVYAALVEDLHDRGLLEGTLILSGGEMGRSPKPESTVGSRGHWNEAQSFILAGGGFTGGNIVGATDEIGAFVTDKHYAASSLTRTVYHLLGIDPDHEFYVNNRPLRIVPEDGPIIREALA